MVFISYSWDSDEHIEKVAQLIKLLKKSGIKVSWDQDLKLGRRIPSFMEEELQKCDQVLFICTPNYKLKADGRDGGVGYETNVITGELYRSHMGNDRLFGSDDRPGPHSHILHHTENPVCKLMAEFFCDPNSYSHLHHYSRYADTV